MQMEITAFWKPANIPKWSWGPPENMMLVACCLLLVAPGLLLLLACSLLPVACSLPPLACSLQLVACSPWKPFVYIDVNIATPYKLFGDKESDVNENLWSLKISNLEPWMSGKCRALRKWHFQYLTFLRKCTFGANCDQGVILMDVQRLWNANLNHSRKNYKFEQESWQIIRFSLETSRFQW